MLDFIYNHSPIWFQNLMVSVKGKQIIKERYTDEYYKELKLLRNVDNEFTLQESRLNEFYKYLKDNSVYFNKILPNVEGKLTINDLKNFPTMDKETIRKNIKKIVTRKEDLIPMKTGGSTGKSLVYYTHSIDMSRKIAYLDFFKEKHGVYKGMRRASIGGRVLIPHKQKKKVYWRFNKPLNQLMLSAYHANEENLRYYIEKLNQFKPESLDGYTTTIHRISQYINHHNITLAFRPIAIFPTAETLTDEMREDIEQAFKCPVRNQYASSEGSPFITEDINGELKIAPASGVFELEHIQGNIYELIVTGFYTTTTPLIRYKIGDSVELYELLDKNYKQQDIKIKRIIGRNNDFLISNERGIITNVNLSTVIKEAGTNIIQSQFVQNRIDEINVNLVLESKADKNELEKTLRKKLNTRFGNSTIFKFNYLNEIPQTSGGKTRFTINNLEK